jgi:deoxyribonuclease-1
VSSPRQIAAFVLFAASAAAASPMVSASCRPGPFVTASAPSATPKTASRHDRFVPPALARPPRPLAFVEAKRALERSVYDVDHRVELYCGCAFDERKRVDFEACESAHPYAMANFPEADRAGRIEWDHILPASWLGHELACWSEPHAPQRDHRDHCRVTSPEFALAEGDMHNLLPAIGQLNAMRENYAFGEIPGESHIAGCDFELENRLVEPRPEARGIIARAMLYAAATYGIGLDLTLYETLIRWNDAYPPGPWEQLRNARIEQLQGNRNPYIDGLRPSAPPPDRESAEHGP